MDKNINSPKVTVFMPAYNAQNFIAQSIESVLEQTFENFELLIINDGSTDDTMKIASSFSDKRIRVINNQKNSGLVSVRNQGIKESLGEYIAFLDADDIALKNRLQIQTRFLDSHNEIALVGGAVSLIDEKGWSLNTVWKSNLETQDYPVALMFRNRFAQSSVMVRKASLGDDPYRDGFAPSEDYDLWVRLSQSKGLFNLPDVIVLYRVNKNGASKTGQTKKDAAIKTIQTKQFESLGISPTEEELQINYKQFAGPNVSDFLNKKSAWLNKLLEANKTQNHFPADRFTKLVGLEWQESCYANYHVGLAAYKSYLNSKLSKIKFNGKILKNLKFIIKCMMRF